MGCFGGGIDRLTQKGRQSERQSRRQSGRQEGRDEGRQEGREKHRQTDWQIVLQKGINIQIYIKKDRVTDRPADWLPTDRYIGRQAGQQAGRQKDRQTGRHTDRQKDRQKDKQTSKYLPVPYCTFLLYSKCSMYVLYQQNGTKCNVLYWGRGGKP